MRLLTAFIMSILLFTISNAQNSWHTQNSGTNKFLTGVYFLDENTGWVTGWTGTILHTSDGGQNWIDQNAPSLNAYNAVQFVDNQTGWAVGYDGRVVRTSDGGASWTLPTPIAQYSISDLHFVNSDTGWTVGGKARDFTDPIREIIVTYDGGNSWSTQMLESGREPLASVFFLDENTGFAVGEFSTILRTDDGGATWIEQMYGTTYHFNDVYFVNSDTGWVVGQDNTLNHFAVIFHTTDGGNTWSFQNFGSGESLSSISFVNDSTGWAVGGTNTTSVVLHTGDGGNTWNPQTGNTPNYLSSTHFVDENHGWAVGFDGTIIRYGSAVTGIDDRRETSLVPKTVELENNFPNPFNPSTRIRFALPEHSLVNLKVYSITGQLVKTLVNQTLTSGFHTVSWDGTNRTGHPVSSGIYIYQLRAGDEVRTHRMHLLK